MSDVNDDIKYIDIAEFRERGYLQEVNRLVLHPLGLALEVRSEDGVETLGGVWDYRDDPEGVAFAPGVIDPEKAANVAEDWTRHAHVRIDLYGSTVQPLGDL